MTEEAVWNRIVAVMREIFEDPTLEITRDTTAADVADWDSLKHIELFVALQAEFGVKFYTGEIATLKNVGQLADTLSARLRGAPR